MLGGDGGAGILPRGSRGGCGEGQALLALLQLLRSGADRALTWAASDGSSTARGRSGQQIWRHLEAERWKSQRRTASRTESDRKKRKKRALSSTAQGRGSGRAGTRAVEGRMGHRQGCRRVSHSCHCPPLQLCSSALRRHGETSLHSERAAPPARPVAFRPVLSALLGPRAWESRTVHCRRRRRRRRRKNLGERCSRPVGLIAPH